ncbi:AraC family transcriptional regulator [Candidatus Uabimicrobium sp. HlEnr_7]|uniref:AraC family transcriptional regulator n=1 Tax=Candidatus Uabimicrobium helgolandensis TaxID=3095367 RepID=UPI00355803C0
MFVKSYCGIMDEKQSNRHNHDNHQILVARKGVLLFSDDCRQNMLCGQSAAFVPRGIYHQARGINTVFNTVYFDDEIFCHLTEYNSNKLPKQVVVFSISPLFRELLNEICKDTLVSNCVSRTALQLLFFLFYQNKQKYLPISLPKSNDLRLSRALCYIDNYYNQFITLEDIASVATTSKRNLERICKRELKINISDYICMRRIFSATLELATTDNSVLSISLNVGYNSLSSFYKAFQKFIGKTPKEYRNSLSFFEQT